MRSTTTRRATAVSVLTLLPLLACQQSDEPLSVRFTEMRRFGCENCSGAEQFSRIQGMAVDAGGGVYVADLYPPFIRVWTSDGSLSAFVGAELANAPPATYSGAAAALYNLTTIPASGFGIAYGFNEYLLSAFDAAGSPRYELTHDGARVARTAEDLAAERERLGRIPGG